MSSMEGRYTLTMPGYTIGIEAYEKIREICPRYGRTVVVIGGRRGVEAAQAKMVKAAEGVGLEFTGFLLAGEQSSYENVAHLCHDHAVQDADMVFGVGGGRALDTAKQVAHTLNKPLFTFPTVAGSCSACSSIATIYTEEGQFLEYAYSNKPPVHVFMCTPMLAKAPVDFLLRGIADTMAKYYESQIASRGQKLWHCDGLGIAMARMSAKSLYAYAKQAVEDNKKQIPSREFAEVVLAVIITSGMVSNLADPKYNGHMAHALFTELSTLSQKEQCRKHAGMASYGTLLLLLCDGQKEEFQKYYEFCQSIGLPTSREETGASVEDIRRVFRATEAKQDERIMPYRITQDMLSKAAKTVETYKKK